MKSQPLHVAAPNPTRKYNSNTLYVQIYVQNSSFLTLIKLTERKSSICIIHYISVI